MSGLSKVLGTAGFTLTSLWGMASAGTDFTSTPVPQATAAARAQQRQQQVRQIRPENYDLSRHPVTAAHESHWRNILWTTALVEPQASYVTQTLSQILGLSSRSHLDDAQIRTIDMAMRVSTQLYLSNPPSQGPLAQAFLQVIDRGSDPQWVATAFSALMRAELEPEQRQRLMARIRQRFPQWAQNPFLYATLREAMLLDDPAPMPPLSDLLHWSLVANQPHLYVICRSNRGTLCRAILKDQTGQFVREQEQLWSVPLLLRSLHDLSWTFRQGQTPQGIYRIEGTVPQPDTEFFRAYGLFPLVKLFVPFEPGVKAFLPGQQGPFTGSVAEYQALLPPTWRNYFPLQQAYWAGKVGRGLFRIHGSGEAPTFFSNNERYPTSRDWNPTIGCLSAIELYDDSGRLLQADMPKILKALARAGGPDRTGYLIVVDVPGPAETPISLSELEAAIAHSQTP